MHFEFWTGSSKSISHISSSGHSLKKDVLNCTWIQTLLSREFEHSIFWQETSIGKFELIKIIINKNNNSFITIKK